MAASKVLVATASFVTEIKGREVTEIKGREVRVHAGERFEATHPVAKARGELFEPEESVGVKRGSLSVPARRPTRKVATAPSWASFPVCPLCWGGQAGASPTPSPLVLNRTAQEDLLGLAAQLATGRLSAAQR
jgi:hypothetical protein